MIGDKTYLTLESDLLDLEKKIEKNRDGLILLNNKSLASSSKMTDASSSVPTPLISTLDIDTVIPSNYKAGKSVVWKNYIFVFPGLSFGSNTYAYTIYRFDMRDNSSMKFLELPYKGLIAYCETTMIIVKDEIWLFPNSNKNTNPDLNKIIIINPITAQYRFADIKNYIPMIGTFGCVSSDNKYIYYGMGLINNGTSSPSWPFPGQGEWVKNLYRLNTETLECEVFIADIEDTYTNKIFYHEDKLIIVVMSSFGNSLARFVINILDVKTKEIVRTAYIPLGFSFHYQVLIPTFDNEDNIYFICGSQGISKKYSISQDKFIPLSSSYVHFATAQYANNTIYLFNGYNSYYNENNHNVHNAIYKYNLNSQTNYVKIMTESPNNINTELPLHQYKDKLYYIERSTDSNNPYRLIKSFQILNNGGIIKMNEFDLYSNEYSSSIPYEDIAIYKNSIFFFGKNPSDESKGAVFELNLITNQITIKLLTDKVFYGTYTLNSLNKRALTEVYNDKIYLLYTDQINYFCTLIVYDCIKNSIEEHQISISGFTNAMNLFAGFDKYDEKIWMLAEKNEFCNYLFYLDINTLTIGNYGFASNNYGRYYRNVKAIYCDDRYVYIKLYANYNYNDHIGRYSRFRMYRFDKKYIYFNSASNFYNGEDWVARQFYSFCFNNISSSTPFNDGCYYDPQEQTIQKCHYRSLQRSLPLVLRKNNRVKTNGYLFTREWQPVRDKLATYNGVYHLCDYSYYAIF